MLCRLFNLNKKEKIKMKEVKYELCEQCEKNMDEAGIIGMTLEEMREQQAQFDFGTAISFLKEGESVARKGWNGKGMFIYLVNGTSIPKSNLRNEAATQIANSPIETIQINSHIDMKAADGSIVVGWLASQTDMLADDWVLV